MVFGYPCAVRQFKLDSQSAIAKTVANAAEGYLRDARNVASESKEIVCILVAGLTHADEKDKKICEEILQELEICVVTYFSFHWKHATSVIEKVHLQLSWEPNPVILDVHRFLEGPLVFFLMSFFPLSEVIISVAYQMSKLL